MGETAGSRFVAAIAARDVDGLRAVLAPDVDFKGLTPSRAWEASDPDAVVDAVFGHWFGDSDHIDAVDQLDEGEPVADTQRIGYRFAVTNGGGPHWVEQQMYYREQDGKVVYARVVCSGYRRRPA